MTIFEREDQIGIIGDKDQIEAAQQLIHGTEINFENGQEDEPPTIPAVFQLLDFFSCYTIIEKYFHYQ
jgi:hypothetical protein